MFEGIKRGLYAKKMGGGSVNPQTGEFNFAVLEGNLVIDPEQAEIVKRIYREYLEGYSMDKIAAGLEADGILTGAGKPR